MARPSGNAGVKAPDTDSFQKVLKLAFELHNSGRQAEAEASCRVLMGINPHDAQLLFLLGMVLQKMGRSAEAAAHLEEAARLEPRSARVFNGLGFVHLSLQDYPRAVENYAKAIELGQQTADTFYSMGNACYQLGDLERAMSLFESAVKVKPKDAASWNNLGKCLKDSNRLEESLAAYDRAVAANPDYFLARYGRAISLLTAGRLTEGFREYNQWRFHRIKPRTFQEPGWGGEAIPGKTLFLCAEQGFGDAIQAVRFIREARQRAGKVILECRPELKTLFTYSGCADVVIAYGEEIPAFDYFAPLLSLPGILGTSLETIPRETPYLKAPPGGQLPPATEGHVKVGLAWAGNPSHHNDAARSIRLEELGPLFQVPGLAWYSLQMPVPARDEAHFRSFSMVDLSGQFKDFLATATVVAEMDLVIAVDTAVAHLAGALARPVWTLQPFSPDWRWFLDREDTPWYPTMRLFRQAKRGEWGPVILRVTEELGRISERAGH